MMHANIGFAPVDPTSGPQSSQSFYSGPGPQALPLPGTGWIPDLADRRDLSASTPKVNWLLGKLRIGNPKDLRLPGNVDLRSKFPLPFQQGGTLSAPAQAMASLVAYFESVAFERYAIPSRLFIYKMARQLMGVQGDSGAFIRSCCEAVTNFGAPPEKYWPFDPRFLSVEPPPSLFSFGSQFRDCMYYRLDEKGPSADGTLLRLKANLAAKAPVVFGFFMFESSFTAAASGRIPFPSGRDRPIGGHAVVAVGYDDEILIRDPTTQQDKRGGILFRNSWGEQWGERGYGWLPYDYVHADLASDFWSLISGPWVDTAKFGLS